MDHKDLDKIIQEQLGDYRENPDPRVWNRIRSSLEHRKKRSRAIPIWLRWGAAAAILVAGLFWWAPERETEAEPPSVTRSTPARETQPEKPAGAPIQSNTPVPMDREGVVAGESTQDKVAEEPASPAKAKELTALPGEKQGKGEQGDLATAKTDPDRFAPQAQEKTPEKGLAELATTHPKNRERQEGMDAEAPPVNEDTALAEAAGDQPPKKSIFEAAAEQQRPPKSEDSRGKWAIGPSLAPVYFNSLGNGSPIASNFVDNAKSGTFNMSYGLQVSYQLSSRLSLRSGIHRVAYGYNTDDVGFTSSPAAATPSSLIRTISYSENSKNLVVHSTVSGNAPPQRPEAIDISAPSAAREGQMLQEFGYLEIPMEMQYNLIDRKWGINLIGGVSSLFLVENAISLESGGAVTEMGEANNMNALNFSTNLGFGMFYRLNPRFEINLQPMFKYQLNTFSQTSGNFQPYSIGVYSGLNFRF